MWGLQTPGTTLGFYMGAGDPNPDLHVVQQALYPPSLLPNPSKLFS